MLQDAVLREVAVEVEYQSLDEAVPGRRVLFPRALLLRGSTLYLIAHQRGREGDALHFAVQRFLSARVRDTWALTSWILGHGENIEVRAPATLRRRVAERLRAAAQTYR